MTTVPLSDVLRHRKEFFQIDDATEYQRVRIRLHVRGVGPRDRVKGHEIKTKRQQACRPGDFIVAEIDAKVGGYGFISPDLDGAIVSSHYFLFEVDETRLLPEYLAFCIRAPWFGEQITAQGSTNYAAIRPHDVLAIRIPLPSLGEQRRIAAHLQKLLGDVEALAAIHEAQAADVAALRRALLDDAVRGRLTEQDPADEPAAMLLAHIADKRLQQAKAAGKKKPKTLPTVATDEQPYPLPPGWAWERFGNVALIASNLTDPSGFADFPHIAPNHIEKATGRLLPYGTVAEDGMTSGKHRFYPGQILYSKIRPALSKAAVVDFDGLCSADMYPISSDIDPNYLLRFILSEFFVGQAVGGANRLAMPKVNQAWLNAALVPVPPLVEQRRIVARVDALMADCDRLDAALATARADAAALVQAALRETLAPDQLAAAVS